MKRTFLLELVVIVGVAWWYANDNSTALLALHRASYVACQQIARQFGTLALRLEDSYRVKVAP
jgi:hypothetical protein